METTTSLSGPVLSSSTSPGTPPRRPPATSAGNPPRHHPRTTSGDQVPFEEAFDKALSFTHLTEQALGLAENAALDPAHAALLRLLADCREMGTAERVLYRQQAEGATYKTLAAIAYKAGLSTSQRVQWYRVAESVPLSQRHAGHIISRMAKPEANSACA
jgi:hypothetical protein